MSYWTESDHMSFPEPTIVKDKRSALTRIEHSLWAEGKHAKFKLRKEIECARYCRVNLYSLRSKPGDGGYMKLWASKEHLLRAATSSEEFREDRLH